MLNKLKILFERVFPILFSVVCLWLFSRIKWVDKHLEYLENQIEYSFDEEPIKVGYTQKDYMIVLHSHNDPGWLLTMQEYETAAVNGIISTSVDYLSKKHKLDKFTYSDISFLESWLEKNQNYLPVVQKLVKEKKLEIINGGVSMHDQATTYYEDILMNYETGRAWTLEKFGILPKVAWSIDPFGPSRTSARLFKLMGYDSLAINRLSFFLKDTMRNNRELIFNWNTSSVDADPNLLTYTVSSHYNTPNPLSFHRKFPHHFGDNPPTIDILSAKFDLMPKLVIAFNKLDSTARNYKEKNVLLLFGDDFSFSNYTAEMEFIDAMVIGLVCNAGSGRWAGNRFNLGSINEYFEKIREERIGYSTKELNESLPLIDYDDSEGEVAWVGFYTSRSHLKHQIVLYQQLVRGVSSLISHNLLTTSENKKQASHLKLLHEPTFIAGILLHHDAITGTCFKHVAEDYLQMVKKGTNLLSQLSQWAYGKETNWSITKTITSTGKWSVVSQVGWKEEREVFVESSSATVAKIDGVSANPRYAVCDHQGCISAFDVILPGFSIINIDVEESSLLTEKSKKLDVTSSFVVRISSRGGVVIKNPENPSFGEIEIGLYRHDEYLFSKIKKKSGMYVMTTRNFVPPQPLPINKWSTSSWGDTETFTGYFDGHPKSAIHIIHRKKEKTSHSKFEVILRMNSLLADDEADFVLRYWTRMQSGSSFKTDSNGLEAIAHNYRSDKSIEISYQPITKWIQISDNTSNQKVSIVTDRPQGGTSPFPGVIEIAVNRVNFGRDNLGIDQHLHEPYNVTIRHSLILEMLDGYLFREVQVKSDSSPLVSNRVERGEKGAGRVSGENPYPTLRIQISPRPDNSHMIRLSNVHDKEEAIIINFKHFLKSYLGVEGDLQIEERSIDYNQKKEAKQDGLEKVTIGPLSIRTFKLNLV